MPVDGTGASGLPPEAQRILQIACVANDWREWQDVVRQANALKLNFEQQEQLCACLTDIMRECGIFRYEKR
jgi:hypothetical protein